MIENIGNPEITRKHLSEMQTFYEAQLAAFRAFTALKASMKPLQDAADVLRDSGVVNVDALLSQPVSATKAMIDEMEAEADELNDLTPHEGEEVDDAFENLTKAADIMQERAGEIDAPAYEAQVGTETDIPPMPEGEGWMRNTGEQPFAGDVAVEVVLRDGTQYLNNGADDCGNFYWGRDDDYTVIWYRKAQPVEQEAEPAPAPEGFIPWEAGPDPFREMGRGATGVIAWYGYCSDPAGLEGEANLGDSDYWEHKDDRANWITALKLPKGYELVDAEGGKVVRKIDHAAEATAQIEAQAETDSAEPEAMIEVHLIGGQSIGYIDDDEPDTAETMQAIAEAVEAVDDEPEAPATPDETVTEQPETVEPEPEAPSRPEPKAERKSYDFTNDYTQEEVLAQSGNANFDPRPQSDDIAAAEREEFNSPRVHNPWNTAKAEG